MKRQVVVLPRAESQLFEAALWWSEHRSQEQAFRWLEGFEAALLALEESETRLSVAPENSRFDFPFIARQLTFGLGIRPTHRAIIEVRGSNIYVHSIRHLAQDEISPDDI